MCCVCKLDIWLLQLTDPEALVQRQEPCMGRDSCGHLCRKSLRSHCRYTGQCSNWCWDWQMPEIRMTFLTIITFNQLQSKPLVYMASPLPPSLAVSQRNLLTFEATPGRDSDSSACLWPWSEGTLLAYLPCVQIWSDFRHPRCINECSCPSLASLQWIPIAFRMSVLSVSFIVFSMFFYAFCKIPVQYCFAPLFSHPD